VREEEEKEEEEKEEEEKEEEEKEEEEKEEEEEEEEACQPNSERRRRSGIGIRHRRSNFRVSIFLACIILTILFHLF